MKKLLFLTILLCAASAFSQGSPPVSTKWKSISDAIIPKTADSIGIINNDGDTTWFGGNGKIIKMLSEGNVVFSIDSNGTVHFINYSFPLADGTNGQVLKTDGGGGLSWGTDVTGAGGAAVVTEEDGTLELAATDTLNFTTGLDVTNSGDGQIDIAATLGVAIDGNEITDGSITGNDIANNSVLAHKIVDGSIWTLKLDTAEINLNFKIATAGLADSALAATESDPTLIDDGQIIIGNKSGITTIIFDSDDPAPNGVADGTLVWDGPNNQFEFNEKVGIKVVDPKHTLTVAGDIALTGDVYIGDIDVTPDPNLRAMTRIGADSAGVGLSVDNSEIIDGTILEEDLDVSNGPTDNYVLTYNLAGTNFTWAVDATGSGAWVEIDGTTRDTIVWVDPAGDSSFVITSDGAGNVLLTVGKESDNTAQTFRIKVDTLDMNGDVIMNFAGTALSFTAGVLNVGGLVDAQMANDALDVDKIVGDVVDDDDLDPAAGGTGVSTLPQDEILMGNGTGDIASLAPGNAQIIIGDGVGPPTLASLSLDVTMDNTGAVSIAGDAVAPNELYDSNAQAQGDLVTVAEAGADKFGFKTIAELDIATLASPVFTGVVTIPDFLLTTGGADGAYDPTDVPANGDVLTWNTGGAVDWQPDATGSGFWVEGTDTLFLIDGDGDTLAAMWDDDAGNVRWQVATEDQTLRILIDSLGLGGDLISEFAGAGLTVVSNELTVDDDGHDHVITNVDAFTKANLETQTSDVDDYAEADGDTWTGVHDFGGATTFELPNGNNPTVTVSGDVGYDNNDNVIRGTDGTLDFALGQKEHFFSMTISNIDSLGGSIANDTIPIFPVDAVWAPFGIELTKIGISTRIATSDTVIFFEYTVPDASGTETLLDSAYTAAGLEGSTTSFVDATVDAGTYLMAIYIVDQARDAEYTTIWGTYYIITGD